MNAAALVVRMAAVAAALGLAGAPAGRAADNFSPAEQAVFLADHLQGTKPPRVLAYVFRHSGGDAFDDRVALRLQPAAGGGCCKADTEFLSGGRRVVLPPVEAARANPVILSFLEHDVREMERLTGGKSAYFRKRIRMAIFEGAHIEDTTAGYEGRAVAARRVVVEPYHGDARRDRLGPYERKRYEFVLSKDVPGGVLALRTHVPGVDAVPTDLMILDGASLEPPK